VERIEALQEIQRRNRPTSDVAMEASRLLQSLFAEMARRQSAGLLD